MKYFAQITVLVIALGAITTLTGMPQDNSAPQSPAAQPQTDRERKEQERQRKKEEKETAKREQQQQQEIGVRCTRARKKS